MGILFNGVADIERTFGLAAAVGALVDRHAVVAVVGHVVLLLVLLVREVAVPFEVDGLRDARRVDAHLADRHPLLLVHPDRVLRGVGRRLEPYVGNGLLYALAHRVVHDFRHVALLQLVERLAHYVFYLVLLADGSVEGLLVQHAARRVALGVEGLAVGAAADSAAHAQLAAALLAHVVGRVVGYEQLVGNGQDILGEGRPRLHE